MTVEKIRQQVCTCDIDIWHKDCPLHGIDSVWFVTWEREMDDAIRAEHEREGAKTSEM